MGKISLLPEHIESKTIKVGLEIVGMSEKEKDNLKADSYGTIYLANV